MKIHKILFAFYLPLLLLWITTARAQNFTLEWVKQMGGHGYDGATDIAVDNSGNVYVTGYFSDTAIFDRKNNKGTLVAVGGYDIFAAKLDADGHLLWLHQMGGKRNEEGSSIAVDSFRNVYITGYFEDTAIFGLPANPHILRSRGNKDAFLLKMDTNGNLLWVDQLGGPGNEQGNGVIVDDTGAIYTTGMFNDNASLNPGSLRMGGTGRDDTYVFKFNTDGRYIWVRLMGAGPEHNITTDIAIDDSGNVYTTGYFAGRNNFGYGGAQFNRTSAGGDDIFITKINNKGENLWVRAIGDKGMDRGNAITTDGDGNIYVTGSFSGTVNFNPEGIPAYITADGAEDIFLLKLNGLGDCIWVRNMGGAGDDHGNGVAVDLSGNVYTTGYFNSRTAYFNPGDLKLSNSGSGDVFIARSDPDGNFVWTKKLGGPNIEEGTSIFIDNTSNIYTTGYFMGGPADFDPAPNTVYLTASGSRDIFVHKMSFCKETPLTLLDIKACDEYIFNGQRYEESGEYLQQFPGNAGCDSLVRLKLTINTIAPVSITVEGFILSTQVPYSRYQWLLDGEILPDATERQHMIAQNGSYQVIVTDGNGCTDTSESYMVGNYVSIYEIDKIARGIHIHPNPSADRINIQSPVRVNIQLSTIEGKSIIRKSNANNISLRDVAPGVYLLHIFDDANRLIKVEKIVKAP